MPSIDFGRPVSDHPLNLGLTHWWSGAAPGSGAKRLEDIVRPAPGTATTNPSQWQSDPYGNRKAPVLDGSSTYYDCGLGTALGDVSGLTEFSIQAYALTTTLTGGTAGLRYLASLETAVANGMTWVLRGEMGNNRFQFFVCDTGNTVYSSEVVAVGLAPFRWELITGRYKQGVGTQTFYNTQAGTPVASANAMRTSTIEPVEIGSLATSAGRTWSGPISDIRLFNRYLADDEIWSGFQEFNQGCPNIFNYVGTKAYLLPALPTPEVDVSWMHPTVNFRYTRG